MLMLCMLVLSARCSGSDEIPLERAEQSSVYYNISAYTAEKAFDNNLGSAMNTDSHDLSPWWRAYFRSFYKVEKVELEKGNGGNNCQYNISVLEGSEKKLCGTYKPPKTGFYYNEVVQCGDKRGDSVLVAMSGCESASPRWLQIQEIKVYGKETISPGKDSMSCISVFTAYSGDFAAQAMGIPRIYTKKYHRTDTFANKFIFILIVMPHFITQISPTIQVPILCLWQWA